MSVPVSGGEDAALIRSALVTHIAGSLASYRNAPSAAELSAWLRPLSTRTLAVSLGRSPGDTAARLADALALEGAAALPADAITAAIASEYPMRGPAERDRLAEYVKAVQALKAEGDGTVTASALYAAGFGSHEASKLLPAANHIMAVLSGEAIANPAEPLPPIERLRRAGERAELEAHFVNAAT